MALLVHMAKPHKCETEWKRPDMKGNTVRDSIATKVRNR